MIQPRFVFILTAVSIVAIAASGCAFDDEPEADVDSAEPQEATEQELRGFATCGGFAGKRCPSANQLCIDYPLDGCVPWRGGHDCSGICLDRGAPRCGGSRHTKCPKGLKCIDVSTDRCVGRADCAGICVKGL